MKSNRIGKLRVRGHRSVRTSESWSGLEIASAKGVSSNVKVPRSTARFKALPPLWLGLGFHLAKKNFFVPLNVSFLDECNVIEKRGTVRVYIHCITSTRKPVCCRLLNSARRIKSPTSGIKIPRGDRVDDKLHEKRQNLHFVWCESRKGGNMTVRKVEKREEESGMVRGWKGH